MTPTTRRHVVSLTLLLSVLWAATPALAAMPRLVLGRMHIRPDGTVVVPVVLETRPGDGIAGLDFRLETVATPDMAIIGADGGAALTRARAQLGVEVAAAGNGLHATVVPGFGLPLPVLRRGRVAMVYVRSDTSRRRVRRALRLSQVTFADIAGKAIRPEIGVLRRRR